MKTARKRKSVFKAGSILNKSSYKYLACECGREERVDVDTVSVLCSICFTKKVPLPEPVAEYVPSGHPAGWHFMTEYVDKDGNVFHRGKEQPKLKGTLPPTPPKVKAKTKRRSKEEILVEREAKKRKALKRAEKAKAKLLGIK